MVRLILSYPLTIDVVFLRKLLTTFSDRCLNSCDHWFVCFVTFSLQNYFCHIKLLGKNSGKVLPQYFAYERVSWQDN